MISLQLYEWYSHVRWPQWHALLALSVSKTPLDRIQMCKLQSYLHIQSVVLIIFFKQKRFKNIISENNSGCWRTNVLFLFKNNLKYFLPNLENMSTTTKQTEQNSIKFQWLTYFNNYVITNWIIFVYSAQMKYNIVVSLLSLFFLRVRDCDDLPMVQSMRTE